MRACPEKNLQMSYCDSYHIALIAKTASEFRPSSLRDRLYVFGNFYWFGFISQSVQWFWYWQPDCHPARVASWFWIWSLSNSDARQIYYLKQLTNKKAQQFFRHTEYRTAVKWSPGICTFREQHACDKNWHPVHKFWRSPRNLYKTRRYKLELWFILGWTDLVLQMCCIGQFWGKGTYRIIFVQCTIICVWCSTT